MKGFLLAVIATGLYFVAMTIALRYPGLRGRAAILLRLYLVSLPLYVAVWLMTPADLGVLPGNLVESFWPADLAFGLLSYGAAFAGGLLQLYNLADRGFSLRILNDLDEAGPAGLTEAEIAQQYSAGRGVRWMYEKRIEGMLSQDLVEGQETLVLTERGRRTASIMTRLQALYDVAPQAQWVKR